MASTYTSRLRLVRPTTGELNNTWGDVFNQQFSDLIDAAIAGYSSITIADVDTTLTALNGSTDQSRNAMLRFTGTLSAARNVVVPTSSKIYYIFNDTTGGYNITVKTAAGTGVTVPAGKKTVVACDGTNVVDLITYLPAGTTINGETLGYLGVPQNSQSADYTLVLGDSGKHIYHPASDTTSRTWTIPANSSVAFPIGTTVTFVNDLGAGQITLQITGDTLVYAATGSTGTRVLAAPAMATILKVASTRWVINGTSIT